MTSLERVLKTLNHEEPDRVPMDMGGTIMSGIMAHALDRLRRALNLEYRPVKVYEIFQMLGFVELDVIDRLGIDVLPLEPPVQFFDLPRNDWKPWKLWDGTDVLVPGKFDVETDASGNLLLRDGGDPARPVTGRMPKDGFYFDMPALTSSDPDFTPPPLEQVKKEAHVTTEVLEFLAGRAEHLRSSTDKALVLGCWDNFGLAGVGGLPDYLCLMLTDKDYLKALFEVRTETALKNMEKVKTYLGDKVDILGLDGFDFGSQKTELINPELFEELFVPWFRVQNDWVHEHTTWKTSAEGMDPGWLKNYFGDKLVFWGGGVDTQRTLPFGTPEDVAAQVRERVRVFAPGGGFVFNTIHNIQQNTPSENIIAAYDTARTAGEYPIRM